MLVLTIVFILAIPFLVYSLKRYLSSIGREILITDIRKAIISDTRLTDSDRVFLKTFIMDLKNNKATALNIQRAENLIYK